MNVAQLVVHLLNKHGVKQIFGIPGDAINDIMEAVRVTDDMDFIQVKHEEGGALAASVQAKLTGRLTACVGTSGPGAIHLLNGLYDAKLDHAPVIAITGQVETRYLGTDYHQEVDLERLFSDVAVYSETLTTPEQFPDVLMEACRAAIAHRGVAHVSIPSDVAGRDLGIDPDGISEAAFAGRILPSTADCSAAVDMLRASRKTAILAGIGAAGARGELLELANRLKAPIVRTLRAKTFIDDDHPLCVGGIGLLGGKPAVHAFQDCDTLLMVGTDFPYQDFYPRDAKVIQIDLDPTQIGKRHPADLGVVGEARAVLSGFLEHLEEKTDAGFLEEVQGRMHRWRDSQEQHEIDDGVPIKPQRLLRAIADAAPDDAIYVCDTGTVNAWSARHLRVRAGQMFTQSACLGTMGVALPGAIGARLAYPDRKVIAIAGDGGFTMTMNELITAVRYGLPIAIVVLNNAKLGFIGLEQEAKGLPAFGIDIDNPDFALLAQACGALGERVEQPDDLAPALDRAMEATKPYVVDVRVNAEELIMPPEIEVGQALNFAKAKVREWVE
ncbi:MAG: thiamine pyrophosphate-dependent enzyme [Gammaproteobacteria bacterium]